MKNFCSSKNSRDCVPKYITIEELNSVPNEPKPKIDLPRPVVICGLTINCNVPSSANITENLCEEGFTQFHCLVVYDFQFSKDTERENENQVKKSSRSDLMSNIVMSMINDIDCSLMDVSNCSDEMAYISDINYQTFKMLKETESNNYQNLIPGESDKIFLPPLPKLEDQDDVDASTSLLANNFAFINGPVNQEIPQTNEKSISDHISELKNSKTKKLNYSHAVQCVILPQQYKNDPDLEIFEVIPTLDKTHIVVVVRSISGNSVNALMVYSLNFTSSVVKINENPIFLREFSNSQCPVEVSVIPSFDKLNATLCPEIKNTLEGSAVLVCSDGVVRIIDLASSKMCIAKLESNKFISAAYCNSLERLCAATTNGSLHFYALNDVDTDIIDDHDEEELCGLSEGINTSVFKSDLDPFSKTNFESLSLQELRHMHSLCSFEPLSAAYCVVVPACWSEMQQVQRQRRHPQYAAGDEQHTRTWRLQTDTTTWDEHIFEITLPCPVSIGHMDIHFSLHNQQSNPPHVEITLLRQNTAGIGHRIFQVDEGLSFDFLQRNQNPVTSQEYLRSHNADILAGPINLADCVDLSEQNGCVILTSPKLFKMSNRTLLLHIKALCDPSKEHSSRKEFKRNRETSSNGINNTASNIASKAEYYMGCDCLHELSITIYKTKQNETPSEKNQRSAMLESNIFLMKLLECIANSNSIQQQSLIFDMLLWISSIRLARNRGSNGEAPLQQYECIKSVESSLELLFKNCLLASGRSIARKCVKFIVTCSNGARYINDTTGQQFDSKVLQALLHCLPDIGCIWSAGSLHWLVVLMLRVARGNSHLSLATQCTSLLCQIAHEIHNRTNSYHLLLRSHFGLFGTPLEPELFDVDPPAPVKSSSVPVTYASVVNGEQNATSGNNFTWNEPSLDPKEMFVSPSNETKVKLKSVAPNKHMRGLLETEPLHFACVSASDGTRVERFDLSMSTVNLANLFGPVTVQATQNHQTGTKKVADSDDVKDKENNGITTLDITLEPVTNNAIELECKKITKLLLNAHEKDNSEVSWPVLNYNLTNKLDSLEMTVDDPDVICIKNSDSNTSSSNKDTDWGRNENIELLSPPLGKCSLQQLLVSPPQQVMVVERMQSGARRFVTLDFGAPVLLTDVIIPACHDLVSLSLDLWLKSEETDAVRLVLAPDIGTKTLVLNDLQPPPVCRFIKVSFIHIF